MSELNKKLSALSRKQGQQNGMAYSDIKPATIKPVKQANLKPWAALGVLSLGAVMGIGGWQLWQSEQPVSEVVKAVSPVATAEAASPSFAAEAPSIAKAEVDKTESKVAEPQVIANIPTLEQKVIEQEPASKTVEIKAAVVTKPEAKTKPAPTVSAPKAVTPTITAPKAPQQKVATAPAVTAANSQPMKPTVTTDSVDGLQQSNEIVIEDGDESLMIETVELDSGQLAQIEYKRAEKALKEGDSRKAIGYLETAIKYNPQWVTARQKLAALYYGRGDSRRAITTLQQGLVLDTHQPDLRLTMAKLLLNESQQQAALNVLSQMPSYVHSGYLAMRGALAQQLNQNDLALSSYQNLVKAEPYDGRWWLGLGVALERGQELEQAEEAYQQALRMGQISGETQQFIRQRLAVLANSKG
ncbi:tetratricopeptide repeat protein [Photobacterium rosenbergii]|uniref:tetratricopeptide repeat protein n=1 Tax=Photobacterium rosenbergii TaxID=294936 RepID=UPI001C99EFC7|nr:tetratricopeptide repeat protein [Photobacterium rosenbergii]MBY5949082.1 tetratricopeptide repeat protein [Photobacterium rosenbergii]